MKKILLLLLCCLFPLVSCDSGISLNTTKNTLVEKVENVEYGIDLDDNCYDIIQGHYESGSYELTIDRSWHIPFEKVNVITTYTISYYSQTAHLYIYTQNYLLELVRYAK